MAEPLGYAFSIQVVEFTSCYGIGSEVNKWLEDNPDALVIDIKYSSSATSEDWGSDALIIYRKPE